jgi:hypothetical protein
MSVSDRVGMRMFILFVASVIAAVRMWALDSDYVLLLFGAATGWACGWLLARQRFQSWSQYEHQAVAAMARDAVDYEQDATFGLFRTVKRCNDVIALPILVVHPAGIVGIVACIIPFGASGYWSYVNHLRNRRCSN